ncbi:MAG: signal recognition particle-docking protein FtsY [Alphaproteobacteria bacterium]|nr:MAG: signal recognition particle-docking protein FtsY [Alphaproteobacteria bacterium]
MIFFRRKKNKEHAPSTDHLQDEPLAHAEDAESAVSFDALVEESYLEEESDHDEMPPLDATDIPLPAPIPPVQDEPQNLLARLRSGLSKTSQQLSGGLTGIFTKRKLDDATLEELEELLIMSDMGVHVAQKIVHNIRTTRFGKEISADEIKHYLAEQIASIVQPCEQPITFTHRPTVIMAIGVNGNGKTTSLGKLAARYRSEGKTVMLAAADTFRAAAVEQLKIWAQRADVPIITGAHEADPASVAYQALEQAIAQNIDVLLIDTAGRLHNKHNLMQELGKITRVIKKLDEHAPHHVVMVLDGTTGQNALAQAKNFSEMIGITGFIVTKLDGTAKGGVVVALAHHHGLPVHYIGVGESLDDMQEFRASWFARSLVGLE